MATETDYQDTREALAELLIYALPMAAGDVADRLLSRYGSLGAVLAEVPEGLAHLLADVPAALSLLSAVRAAMLRSLKADVVTAPFAHARALVDFLRLTMAYREREIVRVLYLAATPQIILDEVVSTGSATAAPFPQRQILGQAISVGAAGLIIVHNHPGGNPQPSRHDIAATRKLIVGAAALDIIIHDHLIVARTGWASFRELGLLGGG